jgi:hypothetical protein
VPDSTISWRECEVQTASVFAPAACPALSPEGASSTTRPGKVRSVCLPSKPNLLTSARVNVASLGAGKVRIRVRFAVRDVVGRDEPARRDRDFAALQRPWRVDVTGCQTKEVTGQILCLIRRIISIPDVTIVHLCAVSAGPERIWMGQNQQATGAVHFTWSIRR